MMVIKTAHDNGKGIDGNAIIDGNGIIDGKWCAVCVCCGPDSVPPRSLPKYFMQSKAKDDTEVCASSDPIWVHCSNMKCQLPPQKFEETKVEERKMSKMKRRSGIVAGGFVISNQVIQDIVSNA